MVAGLLERAHKPTPELNLKVAEGDNGYFVLCYYNLDLECEERLERPDVRVCAHCSIHATTS
jgi:hypothetical protein